MTARQVVLVDRRNRKIWLVEQFRYSTFASGPGWLEEIPAGMPKKDETIEAAAAREIKEETGFADLALEHISTFYVSPGGTSERIVMFYAFVDGKVADPVLAKETQDPEEDIRLVEANLDDFMRDAVLGRMEGRQDLDCRSLAAYKPGTPGDLELCGVRGMSRRKPTCFVIMPFGKKTIDNVKIDFDLVWKLLIREAGEAAGFEIERADSSLDHGHISSSMIQDIYKADVAIADVTIHNPNVFYELGLRHALSKHGTILIKRANGELGLTQKESRWGKSEEAAISARHTV